MTRVNPHTLAVLALLATGASAQVDLRGAPAGGGGAANGEMVYRQHCLGCHGERGDGKGAAAASLFPAPRDFVTGSYRLRSTRSGTAPSDADLLAVVTRGVPGHPMPGFAFLPLEQRRAAVEHVKRLSPIFSQPDRQPVSLTIETPTVDGAAAIPAGKAVYERLACAACHGESGRGDGAMAEYLRDERQAPVRPRDLAADPFKGGESVRDIYVRLSSGMDGTPMKAVTDADASSEERWQLAAYVASLRAASAHVATVGDDDPVIASRRINTPLPIANPLADVWNTAPPTQVALYPLSSRQSSPPRLVVRSLRTNRAIAFRLEWPDATNDDATSGTEQFADGAAIQFVSASRDAFLGMGDAVSPVRIWHWKADWQRQIAAPRLAQAPAGDGQAPHSVAVPPAVQANNPFARAQRSSAIEEMSAGGAATLLPAPLQRVRGGGVWRDGSWYVVFARNTDAASGEPAGAAVKLAVAVWDGADRDRGGRKAVSTWYRLNRATDSELRFSTRGRSQ
jgi:DMSO reductase family type II enzyme heme b subunit